MGVEEPKRRDLAPMVDDDIIATADYLTVMDVGTSADAVRGKELLFIIETHASTGFRMSRAPPPSPDAGGLTDMEFADVRGRVWARKASNPWRVSPRMKDHMIRDGLAMVAEIECLRRLVGEA